MFEKVVLVMGLFAFAKQAPKLIGDVLGVDSGNMKLGIGGKLAAGGALGMAAMAGAGITSFVRNGIHGVGAVKDEKGIWNKFKAAGRVLPSALVGTASGMAHSAKSGFSAKNFKDTRAAAGEGARSATAARDKREAYRRSHGNNFAGVVTGHFSDAFQASKEWAQGGFEAEERQINYYNSVLDAQSKAKAEAEKLRDKNANNINLMQAISQTVDWKGSPAQKEIYDSLFRNLVGANGDEMSLEAVRSYVDAFSKRDTSNFSAEELQQHSIDVANYKNMLSQIEKTGWQAMERGAYDKSMATVLGMTSEKEQLKFLAIKKEVDNLNNIRKSGGDVVINPTNFKEFNEVLTKLEHTRDEASADLERKKREREARQQNNSKK